MIVPRTSSCAISVSPDCNVIVGDEPSAVSVSLMTSSPPEVNVILPATVPAAAELAVENTRDVALLDAENVHSATASIFDATSIESVPLASSGA